MQALPNPTYPELDLAEPVQHVELGQVEGREAVDQAGVTELGDVQPAAATGTAGRGPVLGAHTPGVGVGVGVGVEG